ncbi:MAG: hypothetical protein U5K79_13540 [Cyclobacteriaceae bacterium]|nr:hypothetical protein [Cyclobacteriaceae bacterium]
MKNTTRSLTIAVAFSLMLSACSSVTVLLKPDNSNSFNFDKVLIIAMTTDYNLRSMVEEQLSYELRQMDYHLFSSVNVDPDKKELYTRDELIQLAEEKSLDGVIVVRLKDVESKERYSSNSEVDPYAMNNFFFYTTTYTNVYNWSYIQEKTVTVETALFDAKTKKMIYQAEATYKNSGSQEEGASAFGKEFAKAYQASGLLKKKE